MRRSSWTFALLVIALLSFGQVGNEWINAEQNYYKFTIDSAGFYRVNATELEAAGFPVASVPANRIQLFRRGDEVAILMNTNPDGTLNYFEFYGEGNNGEGDAPLYESGAQPHTYYNLFSDEASYFVTYQLANENGKRMAFSPDRNAVGLTPEGYHLADSLQLFTSSYGRGIQFGPSSQFTSSAYENGEGWTGGFQTKNVSRDFQFQLQDLSTDGPDPKLETVLIGGNSLSHNIAIYQGSSIANLSLLDRASFSGYVSEFRSASIPRASVGVSGEVALRVVPEGSPGAADRASVAYLRIEYPQELNLGASSNKIFTLDAPAADRAWLQINTVNASGTRFFDITDSYNAVRLATSNFSSRVEVVVPNAAPKQRILAVTQVEAINNIEPVLLPDYDFSSVDYLIVTHEALGDPVQQYETYRESAAGGSFEVLTTTISDLYNVYNYGDPSPLAVRRFLLDADSQTTLLHVFLIGKGFSPNFNYYRGDQAVINVPTYGLPGGDLSYVLGLNGSDSDLPGVGIGRLNARTAEEVQSYLDKIIEMEALPYDQLFRKDFLQLSGGVTQSEITNFGGILEDFTRFAETDFIGGRAFNTGKSTSDAVEFINVTDRINAGVGFVTFFGHSSGQFPDIEIGRVSDPQFGFTNKAKYPVFLVNGCQAGEIYGNAITFGEDWMLTPDLGAVAFMAHSDIALSSALKRWSDFYYEVAFGDELFFGEAVGTVIKEISRRYKQRFGSVDMSLSQIQLMTLQGDPAYKMFGGDRPDYEVTSDQLRAIPLVGENVVAFQDSFQVEIIVKNYGRTVTDSLLVQIDRLFPNGDQESYFRLYERPLRQDTLQFFVPLDPARIHDGTNLLTIRLDPTDVTSELDELNNVATLEVPVYSGNTAHLFPRDNGLQASSQVMFVFQSSNVLEGERSYDLEIDNTPDFSGLQKIGMTIQGEALLREEINVASLVNDDTTTLYWRSRYSEPQAGELNEWVTTSFTIINDVPDGWGQYEPYQSQQDFIEGIVYNETTREWEFQTNSLFIDIGTFGANHPSFTYADLRAVVEGVDLFITGSTIDPFCEENTLNAIVFDKESAEPYRPVLVGFDVLNRELCGRLPQRIYQFREVDLLGDRRRLQVLVDNMQQGDLIVLFTIGSVNFSLWDAELNSTLNELGVDVGALSLTDGQPIILFGKKGDSPGSAIAITGDGTPSPPDQQAASFQTQVNGSFVSGQIRSRRIGPARSWTDFSYRLQEEVSDNAVIQVNGIDENGNATNVISRARAETIDIATLDPNLYPELELIFAFDDETEQTPPQFDFWEIKYEFPPEGLLLPVSKEQDLIREGQEIERSFRFINIAEVDFTDSLNVMARLVNQSTGNVLESSFRIAPPAANDTTSFDVRFSSFGRGGLNTLVVTIDPNENEMYSDNNQLTLPELIEVNADETNPLLDVTFDGFHILDGDVVSPNPRIAITLRDDNPFIPKTDTTGVNISLKLPGEESVFQRVNFSDPRLNYVPADENRDFEVAFQPGPLENGMYALRVQAADQVGNQSGTDPYEINFEVINESTVTHFYPYPNPFSTSCRFVFTLTGSEIPDQIKIQILTVSGRVVREITQDEIGPMRIGNNITSYAWDGRDEFGDQLANGVYFYKVFINSNGESLQRRSTRGDGAFKNGFGKLYILR